MAKKPKTKKPTNKKKGKDKDTKDQSVKVLSGKLREANAKLKKLQTKIEADKDKKLEEQKKYKQLADKRKLKAEKLQKKLTQQTITAKVREAALKAGAKDADDFVRLVDTKSIEVAEDGTIDSKQVSDLVKETKEDKPYLFGKGEGGGKNIGSGDGGNDGGSSKTPTFKRSQLKDSKFYAKHEKQILKASAEGKIIDDITPTNQTGQPQK